MGSRLLCSKIFQLSKTLHTLTLAQRVHVRSNAWSPVFGHGLNTRALHVKIYDKDAGLDAQREENKQRENDELQMERPAEEDLERTNYKKKQSRPRALDNNDRPREAERRVAGDNDPDVFGNLTHTHEDREVDPTDVAEEEYISRPTRRIKKLHTKEYAHLIKQHLNANRLKSAIDVLEERMIKEDRAKPENYIYNLLISGCAKAGYTRKAFGLFTRMRQRGLKVTGGTYTSLFNACANAPSADDGLSRANHLREIMLEKSYEPNVLNYNAMIKAYGRCGDVKTAYLLADEMLDKNLEVNTSTFNFLLQACASDSKYGFRHCLLTWHKMLKKGIQPDYYSFNTVLRCVRDCGFGDLRTMEEVLKTILEERKPIHLTQPHTESKKQIEAQEPPQTTSVSHNEPQNQMQHNTTKDGAQAPTENSNLTIHQMPDAALKVETDSMDLEIPNLLAPHPHLGSLVSISEITQAHDRFLLLGGLTGFLDLMKQYNITPGIESFTAMLEVIPPTNAAEKQLISFIRKIGLKADIDFFNVLIKKRAMRFDYEGGREVLSMIRTAGLHPDIVTYGVLSLGCQTEEEARELLEQMRSNNVRVNIEILGAMLRQGCSKQSFPYIMEILQISLDENIKPNEIFLRHLNNFYKQCARAIDARHPYTKSKAFKKGHAKFCDKLRLYYEEQGIAGLKLEDAIQKIKERPYQQYKENDVEGLEPLKNEKLVRKTKLRKYIKKIKMDNLKGDDESFSQEPVKRIT